MKKILLSFCLFCASLFGYAQAAETLTITSGARDLVYNSVYGANLASALSEFGYQTNVQVSKGSIDNLDKIASGEAQIGFTQADAYMYWRGQHPNDAQKVDVAGKLGEECVFAVVKSDGKISSAGDLAGPVKIAVGDPTSGSYASWSYLQSLVKDYNKAETYAKGSTRALAKVLTGDYDVFLFTAAKDKNNGYLDIINQPNSGLKLIDMSSWNVNDKLPSGDAIYTKGTSVTKKGRIVDDTVDVPCMNTLVVASTNMSDDAADALSKVMLKNRGRIMGTGK